MPRSVCEVLVWPWAVDYHRAMKSRTRPTSSVRATGRPRLVSVVKARFGARSRAVLIAVALLAVIGVASYRAWVSIWTNRKYQAASRALERFEYAEAQEKLKSYLYYYPNDDAVLVLAAQVARRRGDL